MDRHVGHLKCCVENCNVEATYECAICCENREIVPYCTMHAMQGCNRGGSEHPAGPEYMTSMVDGVSVLAEQMAARAPGGCEVPECKNLAYFYCHTCCNKTCGQHGVAECGVCGETSTLELLTRDKLGVN